VPVIELGHDLGGLDRPGRFVRELAMTFVHAQRAIRRRVAIAGRYRLSSPGGP
jgi:hypothetical protein